MSSSEKKLWGGRFSTSSASITEKLSASVHYDCRLYRQDIRGSLAHARMLQRMGILTDEEFSAIEGGLRQIENEISAGAFSFSAELEDIHMNIEARLTERIGDAGRKLHTGRSRNDQISVDMRLYLRDEAQEIAGLMKEFISTLIDIAEREIDTVLPGYTHLQVAQPLRFGHHLLNYAWKALRDHRRLAAAFEAAMELPLGVGALAGVNYENDREFLKDELGFQRIMINSMDAVSDRDFILDFQYFAAVLGTHLSRFCEDLILWSSSEFSFIQLDDSVTTGSSIMPQKRNPDLAELIRGKSGRLFGNLLALLTVLKGLPMTYNRDLQEDKEPFFDSLDTVKLALEGMTAMLTGMTVNRERMLQAVKSNFSTATDLADYLAQRGVPFRLSHEIVGSIVRFCEDNDRDFFALTLDELKGFSEVFGDEILEVLEPSNSTERKKSMGSTARSEIERQISVLRSTLETLKL